MTSVTEPEACPDCREPLAVTSGYPLWCAACDWGLAGVSPAGTPKKWTTIMHRWSAIRDRWSTRLVRSLYEQVSQSAAERPGWSAARFASYLLACLIHAFSLGLVALGVWLIIVMPNVLTVILALFMLLIAFETRPRLGSLRRAAHVRRRHDAPELFSLLDRVAAEIGARPVHAVIATGAFNASYARVGLRRRVVLRLGLPLWDVLPPGQKVALLGHEFAHGVNGDARHGLVVGTSVSTLARLQDIMRPVSSLHRNPRTALYESLARVMQAGIGCAVGVVLALQNLIWLRAAQRAEYYADMLAGKLASPVNAADMLDALVTGYDTYMFTLSRLPFSSDDPAALWAALSDRVAGLPELEKERRRRLAARRLRADRTHPPTHLRMMLLRARPAAGPALTLTGAEEERIRAELASDYARVAAHLRSVALARI